MQKLLAYWALERFMGRPHGRNPFIAQLGPPFFGNLARFSDNISEVRASICPSTSYYLTQLRRYR